MAYLPPVRLLGCNLLDNMILSSRFTSPNRQAEVYRIDGLCGEYGGQNSAKYGVWYWVLKARSNGASGCTAPSSPPLEDLLLTDHIRASALRHALRVLALAQVRQFNSQPTWERTG